MIKNQKQAAITRKKIDEFIEAKTELEKKKAEYNPLKYKLAENSLNGIIADLQSQLKDYESLVNENYHCLILKKIEDIPNILIAARLALKMSQKDLAEKIGIQEQAIQRYETTDYEGASWTRIVEVVLALDLKFHFERIILVSKDVDNFHLPKNLTKESVEIITEKIKKEKSFNLMVA